MNRDKYVFSQLLDFLDCNNINYLARKYGGDKYVKQFTCYNHIAFPEIFSTPWGILTWPHYKSLLSVTNQEARSWYLKEASEQMWSYRTLDRNIASFLINVGLAV